LYAAFDKVASLDINQTWQNELSVQKHLIRSNATKPAAAIGRLAKSDVTPLAESLQATYLAAMARER
ncbi:MAG: hypothetical protein KJN90_09825, partial [Gammaproteobacteria bacterium]|nr:hypothetical protein [Gammaproteobacteria bacterium]